MCLNSKWSTLFLSLEACALYSYSSPASCFRAARSESFMSEISLINSVHSCVCSREHDNEFLYF